jgi:hypothetical protein
VSKYGSGEIHEDTLRLRTKIKGRIVSEMVSENQGLGNQRLEDRG